MLTGHANLEVAIESMELGAFDYLLKPIEIDALLYKIQDAFQKKTIQEKKIDYRKKSMGKFNIENDSD
jgi:FixJ family two-component response regulator